MNKPFGVEQETALDHMAGIAVFPTPASSPAMSSLSLAVERGGLGIHSLHTQTRGSLVRLPCTSAAERPSQHYLVRSQSTIYLPQSVHEHKHKHKQNTQPRQAYYIRIYNTSEALPGNLLGAGRNHFFITPSSPASSTSPDCLPNVGTCQQHRAVVAISGPSRYHRRIAKPQCWTV